MSIEPLVIERFEPEVGVAGERIDYDPGSHRYFQKRDIILLKGHIHENRKGIPIRHHTWMVVNQHFVAHSARALGIAIASWGEEGIGADLFEEILAEGKYPHTTLMGIDVRYDSEVSPGDLKLMTGEKEDDTVLIGALRTRGPNTYSLLLPTS